MQNCKNGHVVVWQRVKHEIISICQNSSIYELKKDCFKIINNVSIWMHITHIVIIIINEKSKQQIRVNAVSKSFITKFNHRVKEW